MFYSQSPLRIKEQTSVIDERQVFTGQYWDEFGVTAHLIPDEARVLMAGLAFGGGIRPILASGKKIELHAVDLDPRTNASCRDQFSAHFPSIKFSIHTADARSYLENESNAWDAIWIDLYAYDGYLELLLDPSFFRQVKGALKPGGVALFNLFGIPNQFQPLRQFGPQASAYSFICQEFRETRLMPYRRNMTVMASQGPLKIYPTDSHPALSQLDRATLKLFERRLNWMGKVQISSNLSHLPSSETKFEAIDRRMRAGWVEILQNLGRLDVQLEQPSQLLNLIQDEKACDQWLRRVEQEEPWLEFLPILCAGESDLRELNVHWIFDWTVCNQDLLKSRWPRIYNQIWLPQLWSLILHPSRKFRRHYFRFLPLLNEGQKQ